jgi:hypothetical protein
MTPREELAAAQAALVGSLVAGAPPPPGFDAARLDVTARALLRKRAGEVARAWPRLAAGHGTRWVTVFAAWARHRPSRGSWLDGWDFARDHRDSLPYGAALELLLCEAAWRYDDGATPRRRRVFASRTPGGVVIRFFGRTRVLVRGHREP